MFLCLLQWIVMFAVAKFQYLFLDLCTSSRKSKSKRCLRETAARSQSPFHPLFLSFSPSRYFSRSILLHFPLFLPLIYYYFTLSVCVYMLCACSGMFDFFRVITLFLTLALALLTVCLNSFSSRPLAPWLSISLSRCLPSTPRTKVCGSQQTARHVSSEVQSSPIYPAAQWASTGARQLEGGSRRRRTLLCRLCCHSRFIDWCVFISLNQLITFAYTN